MPQPHLPAAEGTSMDQDTPDPATQTPGTPTPAFIAWLLRLLACATPGADPTDAAEQAAHCEVVRELFDSLGSRSAADALLAALAVATAVSGVDSFIRAARPGVSDAVAARLRSSGLAAGRFFAATSRQVTEIAAAPARAGTPPAPSPEPPAAEAAPEVPPGFTALSPGAKPIPAVSLFQPRDRYGKPIPHHRTDLMTRAQVLAALS